MTYEQWAYRHPQAAAELHALLTSDTEHTPPGGKAGSEAAAQQAVRMSVAQQGGYAWRNNVGALIGQDGQMVRFGLANDSNSLNRRVKSSDLILAIPRLIGPEHVGRTVAQFGSIECKRPGWSFNPKCPRQQAQAKWLELVASAGGFACFSTGEVDLSQW